jgi:hypothetical protein
MNKKTRDIARIIDENIHKKRIKIRSDLLTSNQLEYLKEFIKSFHKKENFYVSYRETLS